MKGCIKMSTKSTGDFIIEIVRQIFGKFALVHDIKIKKDYTRVTFGVRISRVFSAVMSIKMKESISIIVFSLNGKKYKMYLASSKFVNAIKAGCQYVKCLITRDKEGLDLLKPIRISKKEYQQMKKNKLNITRAFKKGVKKKNIKGPLIVSCGYDDEDKYFQHQYAY